MTDLRPRAAITQAPAGPPVGPTSEGSWEQYLADYHDGRPGITEQLFADARDQQGRSPYDWLAEAVPSGASTVVDLACGSGPVARLLPATRVVGVDQSAGELARAPGGLLVRARASAVPIADAVADTVVSSMALMVLVPLEAVLHEIRRLLRPGGTFAATVPVRSPDTGVFAEILAALGQATTGYPEGLDPPTLAERFSSAGLTLRQDDTGLFVRTVHDEEDAGLVVRSFYAPGADDTRVAAAVTGLARRLAVGPVRMGYRIRRLVAVG